MIVGAGGHAAVVAEAAGLAGIWQDICFVDDRYPDVTEVIGLPVIGDLSALELPGTEDYIVAIGDNRTRLRLHAKVEASGGHMVSVLHPTAAVSPSAILLPGTVVLAQAAINAKSLIGAACIVNTGATVDHDCRLGNGVHLSPGVHLAGGVTLGDRAWVGIGASVINNVVVGPDAMVAAGAVVIGDITSSMKVAGVPAREMDSP
ncbi:MAG: acetyltransferase [Gammaproteobacteria bacterium]|nr:acetyltransferase [Gammaproteobacteria bacterium]